MKALALVVLASCAHAPPTQVTLVDYWATWCAACDVVAAKIEAQVQGDRRIVIKKVDVTDNEAEYRTLPQWNVYDTRGRLRYRLIGNETLRAPTLARDLLGER